MLTCDEMPWPPTAGVPYRVGDFTEIVEPGAADGAASCAGERTFRVAEDVWNADYSERRIVKFAAISAT
jgi:hypothetical protein